MTVMPRIKKMVSFALDPALIKRLNSWIAKQELPPKKTAVIEAALKAYLDSKEKRKDG